MTKETIQYYNESQREQVQHEALSALLENKGGIVILPPRFGKSKIAIDFAKQVGAQRVLLIVHGAQQKNAWQEEFKKWNFKGQVGITTYQYIATRLEVQNKVHVDLIILDEVHHISQKTVNILKKLSYNYLIGLTATYPDDMSKRGLLSQLNLRPVYKQDVRDSINLAVSRDFRLYYIPITLAEGEFNKYTDLSLYMRQAKSITEKRKRAIFRANFLYSTNTKKYFVKSLYNELKSTKYRGLTFVNSKPFGRFLDSYNFISSDKSKGVIKDMIRRFNNGNLNRLVLLKVANEGIEFEDVDYILFGSLHASYINFFQRLGRALNSITSTGIATVIVPVSQGTVEIDWLKDIASKLKTKPEKINKEDILDIIKMNKNN